MEWIWYTNSEHFRKLKLDGRIWTAEALGAWVRKRVQKHDEHVLLEPFRGRLSRAAKSPISTRSWNAPVPTCRARALSARWC